MFSGGDRAYLHRILVYGYLTTLEVDQMREVVAGGVAVIDRFHIAIQAALNRLDAVNPGCAEWRLPIGGSIQEEDLPFQAGRGGDGLTHAANGQAWDDGGEEAAAGINQGFERVQVGNVARIRSGPDLFAEAVDAVQI